MDVAPNQTLYLSNLYGKLKKEGIAVLAVRCHSVRGAETKQWLYALFGSHGKILDIVCMGGARFKGQAWVVFADITAATNALRALQDFPVGDGRRMRIQFAQSKSDTVAKLDGSWQRHSKGIPARPAAPDGGNEARKQAVPETHAPIHVGDINNTLFLENLPEATTDVMLSVLFKQFPGFTEARMVPGRSGIAFVEFESDVQASVALSGLQGFKITPQFAMRITYAKQ